MTGRRAGTGRAAFLDRDGTIIRDVGYLKEPGEVDFFPWSIDAVRALNEAGFAVVVITNQSGIARGYLTEAGVDAVHQRISSVIEAGGARIDAYYYCPHHPEGSVEAYRRRCDCRKPGCALIDRACADLDLDPARSFVVGDTWRDVGAARAAGARGVLVRTGYGADQEKQPQPGLAADAVVDNLVEAVSWILLQC